MSQFPSLSSEELDAAKRQLLKLEKMAAWYGRPGMNRSLIITYIFLGLSSLLPLLVTLDDQSAKGLSDAISAQTPSDDRLLHPELGREEKVLRQEKIRFEVNWFRIKILSTAGLWILIGSIFCLQAFALYLELRKVRSAPWTSAQAKLLRWQIEQASLVQSSHGLSPDVSVPLVDPS